MVDWDLIDYDVEDWNIVGIHPTDLILGRIKRRMSRFIKISQRTGKKPC